MDFIAFLLAAVLLAILVCVGLCALIRGLSAALELFDEQADWDY